MQYVLDLNDKKLIKDEKNEYHVYRIVACEDCNGIGVKTGDKGGYIYPGTLSQEGKCWVDENSIVGKGCFISNDALIIGSKLARDVFAYNRAKIIYSCIKPNERVSLCEDSRINNSTIKGDVHLHHESRIEDSNVRTKEKASVTLENSFTIQNCKVVARGYMSAFGTDRLLNKNIEGEGLINWSDKVKVYDKERIRLS